MTAQIRLDQYLLDVEYSYEGGDEYHCLDWVDLSVISGTICLEDSHGCPHGCEECVDMTDDEVHYVSNRFSYEIERKLIEELRDEL